MSESTPAPVPSAPSAMPTSDPAPTVDPSSEHDYRSHVARTGYQQFVATASSGATVDIASKGTPGAFSPVELLIAGLAACGAFGVERFVQRRVGEAEQLEMQAYADLVGHQGNRLSDISVSYRLQTPSGTDADPEVARVLADAIRFAHSRTCTVSLALDEGVDVNAYVGSDPRPAFTHLAETLHTPT